MILRGLGPQLLLSWHCPHPCCSQGDVWSSYVTALLPQHLDQVNANAVRSLVSHPVPAAALSVQERSMCSLIALLEAETFKGDHVRTTWCRFLDRSVCGHLLSSRDCHVRNFCHHLLKWK